jgi:hypothetical protein
MTEGAEHTLLALVPPGSIEAALCGIQDSLFSAHGLVSAISLPPLIPVLFLAPAAGEDLLGRVGRKLPPPIAFVSTGVAWEGGSLWLRMDSRGAWRALREEASGASAASPLFPESEGFCLGCWEAAEKVHAAITVQAPRISFTSCTIALLKIHTAAGPRWWTDTAVEVEAERPLRAVRTGSGKPRAGGRRG